MHSPVPFRWCGTLFDLHFHPPDTPALTARTTRRALGAAMKNSRISRPMIVAILVMFGAWLALGFFLNGRQTGWASGFFFIAIARVLLMAGLVICLIATGISWCMKVKAEAGRKIAAGAGVIAALIIATLSALVAAAGVWDVAYGRGGSGEWSGLGELFVFVVCIPGGIAALESGVADWREVRASDVAGCSPAVTRHSCAATANPIPNFHPLALGNQNPFGNYSGADDGNADVARGGTLLRRIHKFP